MSQMIFLNNRLVPREQAVVSVYDHGLLYGDGVFEGIRVYNGKVFLLEEHVERLYESARAIRLEIPMSPEQMGQALNDTVASNRSRLPGGDGYIRLIVTRGAGTLGLDIRKSANPQVIIIVDTISLYPEKMYQEGLKIITASTIRNHPAAVSPRIKSLNYLNNILAKIEGTDAGCEEALMLNHKGDISECTGDNIFIVKRGVLKTPPNDAGILEGITRNCVIQLAEQAGIQVQQMTLQRHDVYTADECFLTGTAAEVIAVVEIDGRKIGSGIPGPLTQDLRQRFQKFARGD